MTVSLIRKCKFVDESDQRILMQIHHQAWHREIVFRLNEMFFIRDVEMFDFPTVDPKKSMNG